VLKFFGVFGNPVKHSKSPFLHNYVFLQKSKELGFLGIYRRILLQNPELLRSEFMSLNLSGANITLPFKETAFLQCDEVSGIAKEIGTCNTWVRKNGRIIGYNTDAEGFYTCIRDYEITNVLIIGAGGAARAIAIALKTHKIPTTVINRSVHKLDFFIKNGFECALIGDFRADSNGYDLIINATSAGLESANLPCEKSLLLTLFTNAKYAIDIIYGVNTPFLTLAKDKHLATQDGRDMLVYQAVFAFRLFCEANLPIKNQHNEDFTQNLSLFKEIDKIML